ncbi:hypothetical protein GGS20DRAFT_446022 [Poronia punctata]|nr:hypothetical protein GGS20DRAFT_446022 [Poronia punctata]
MERARLYSEEELHKLRCELLDNMRGREDDLGEEIIDYILMQPPQKLNIFLRALVINFGPLSLYSMEYDKQGKDLHGQASKAGGDPIIDDSGISLDVATDVLEGYNRLLEEKTRQFDIQVARSLACLQETMPFDTDSSSIHKSSIEKEKAQRHAMEIALLRAEFGSSDANQALKLKENEKLFDTETLLLRTHADYFERNIQLPSADGKQDELWRDYDYMLSHVDRWAELVLGSSKQVDAGLIDNARELVDRFVSAITTHCHTQLATVHYENTVTNTAPRSGHHDAVRDEAAAISKEIDWLLEEVVPVAHMCVSAQFLGPIVNKYKNWRDTKELREAAVTSYISGVMRFLNERLSVVAERTQILVYHHQALHKAGYVRLLKEAKPQDLVPKSAIPTLAHVGNAKDFGTAAENIRQFIDLYATVPINVSDPYPTPTPSLLEEYVQSRAEKGDVVLKDLHKLFEAATKAGLSDRELGGDLLLESLLADSEPYPVQPGSAYKDTQLENSIAVLRGQANQVKEIFKNLKLTGPANAPDFVAHAYRQTAERLAARIGEDCFQRGHNRKPRCETCIRCLKFEEFLRKWGC